MGIDMANVERARVRAVDLAPVLVEIDMLDKNPVEQLGMPAKIGDDLHILRLVHLCRSHTPLTGDSLQFWLDSFRDWNFLLGVYRYRCRVCAG